MRLRLSCLAVLNIVVVRPNLSWFPGLPPVKSDPVWHLFHLYTRFHGLLKIVTMSGQCVLCQVNVRSWRHIKRSMCTSESVDTYFSLIRIKEQKQCSLLTRKLSKTCSVHHYHRNYLLCRSNFTCVIRTVKSCIAYETTDIDMCEMVTEVCRDTAIQWCLKNAFELVELSSSLTDSDDEGLHLFHCDYQHCSGVEVRYWTCDQ